MEKEVEQLVEMGATTAQARAALKKYKDVMQAAERIFEGQFDDCLDEDVPMEPAGRKAPIRMVTPEPKEDDDEEIDDDGEGNEDEDFIDYDSDYEAKAVENKDRVHANVDPYAGIFFSKDRREEVIEVEEEPETTTLPGSTERVRLMTQGEWMKGCPEGGEQSFLFALYTQLSDGACICPEECGSSEPRKKSDFFAIFPEFSTYIDHLRVVAPRKCEKCNQTYCFACGERLSTDKPRRPTAALDDSLFHCSNLQGVVLGVGLFMLEQMFVDQSKQSTSDQDVKARQAKRRKVDMRVALASPEDIDDEDELYYAPVAGKKAKGGTGYAGNLKEDVSGQLEAQAVQRAKDEKIGHLLSQLRAYLPNLHREGGGRTSDYLVHPTALAHLRRRFNFVSSTLLRNDSLTDMSDRSILYFELMEWLETISNHEALASMMAMPIMVVASIKAVTAKKVGSKDHVRERTIIYEGSSGPRELLEAITIQARAALKGLEGTKLSDKLTEEMTEEQKRMTIDPKGKEKEEAFPVTDETLKLAKFCRRILSTVHAIDRSLRETKGDAFVDRLHASLPKIPSSSTDDSIVDAGDTEESAMKAYLQWATRVRFEYCDLTIPEDDTKMRDGEEATPHYKFYYNNEARMLASSDIPRRSLAIAKELAILTTNLPVAWGSSVFLRVDETRVDVIKALITGPEGTPYHNGCYLFDIFLGPSYNQSPPSVKYMTTNGGKFRFNPNLYADGKVCLSLLGTWQGPGWVSGRSTLLQVLISIQSMILCDEPYLNEPGWASSGGTPQSTAYSANVRRMVVKTAMLENLKNPPEPFGDIIRTHFRLKARSIATQLDNWSSQDDGNPTAGEGVHNVAQRKNDASSSNGNSLHRDVQELKQILQQLRVGDSAP